MVETKTPKKTKKPGRKPKTNKIKKNVIEKMTVKMFVNILYV